MSNWIYEFEIQVHNRGNEIAIIHDGRTKTYDELNREASSFANWLKKHDYKRVAMYLPNSYEFYVAEFGTLKAGASGVPVNYMFAEEIIEYVLNDSEADVLVVFAQDAAVAAAAVKGSNVKDVVTIGTSPLGTITLDEILADYPDYITSAPKADDDIFNLSYTSGTTGRPKGVIKTHRNMSAHITNMVHAWKLGPRSRWLCLGPIYHTSGLESSSLPVLAAGGTVVSLKWNVENFFEHVHKYKTEAAYIVGSMIVDIANYENPKKWDLSSLKFVVAGGAPMNESAHETIKKKYKFILTERLGMTEAGIIFVYPVGVPGRFTPREELPYHIDESCGKPLYNQTQFRLIDPVTGEIKQSGEGELQIKGDSVFKGYWKLPELTQKVFTEDGWFKTGDIVLFSEDGHVYHSRRRDEIIISGGENVSPRAVEVVAEAHNDILEAAMFALPHEHWGQEVCLAVVKKPGVNLSEKELIQYFKESGRLAKYEIPKRIFFRESLPKTPTRSVPRAKLTQEYLPYAKIAAISVVNQ
jgi:acyl-CoA synthetase (AMP-forming)/AMP-acid ligase II